VCFHFAEVVAGRLLTHSADFHHVSLLVSTPITIGVDHNKRRHRQAAIAAEAADSPTAPLRIFLHDTISPDHDSVALLWLDAWRESPRRPALQREVIRQMEIDLSDLSDLLARGVATGEFTFGDCAASAMRILAMIDGTFGRSAVRTAIAGTTLLNYPIVAEMLLRTTGLEAATLD
jgi:hypothetical protein